MSGPVAIERVAGYPAEAPFHPQVRHPELRGPTGDAPNPVFEGVRQLWIDLGLDAARTGRADWNPLGEIIKPGQTVFIKPNMVDHRHRFGGDRWSVVTHPSVVRAVAEYAAIALDGRGRILVGDNPHVDCRFEVLADLYRPDLLRRHFAEVHGVAFELRDLRFFHVPDLRDYGYELGRRPLPGDPSGTVEVDLGRASLLDEVPWWLLRGTYQERLGTIRAHLGGHHRYVFSRSIFDADVLISIPKLKAHAKVGATLAIKGLIGTIADKNGLVHWRIGYPAFGGDEYPPPGDRADYAKLYAQHALRAATPSRLYFHARRRLGDTALGHAYRRATRCEAQRLRMLRGAWEGNDTIWRMTVDVYQALVGDVSGQRGPMEMLSVIDGVMAGDTDGPHFPDPRPCGLLLAGRDLLEVDLVALRLMDFRLDTVRYLRHLAGARGLDPARIAVVSASYPAGDFFAPDRRHLSFKPPHRWPSLSLHGLAPGPSHLPLR